MTAPSAWCRSTTKAPLTLFREQHIKANEGIIASNQSANRDEEVFENPNTFDMHRKWPSQDALGFGFGEHRCIAEHLAKAEMRIAFGESNIFEP